MTFVVEGIGTALPEHRLTQADVVELHTTFCSVEPARARMLRALYRRAGIDTRHSVLVSGSEGSLAERLRFYEPARDDEDPGPTTAARMAMYQEHAPRLAVRAARDALTRGGVRSEEVTHLISVSCTGFVSPGVDSAIVECLRLSPTVERTHVGFMGCHGAFNGLRVARSFTRDDPSAVPLLCAVELCSLHFAYGWDPDMLVANALFADGASALVGRGVGGSSPEGSWEVAATGSLLMPGSGDAMSWRIGDHGFRMTLSALVPDLIERHLMPWMVEWLAQSGLALEDVESWAVHPGGPRILDAVERALDLPDEATSFSRAVLRECGNMSSATVPFILRAMQEARSGTPCVALAFGPGLAVEAALLTER